MTFGGPVSETGLPRYEIKPMTIGEVLDQAILLVRNNLKAFLAITGIVYAPILLGVHVLLQVLTPAETSAAPTPEELAQFYAEFPLFMIAALGSTFLLIVVAEPLVIAPLVKSAAAELLGAPVGTRTALRTGIRRGFPLMVTVLLQYTIIMIGMCLCLVPGIFFLLRYWLVPYVVVFEETSFAEALDRSWNLMKGRGHMLTAFVLIFLLGIIKLGIGMVVGLIPVPMISIPLGVIVGCVGLIITYSVGLVFYFSCRSNAEFYDLALLAQAVASEDYTASAPAPAMAQQPGAAPQPAPPPQMPPRPAPTSPSPPPPPPPQYQPYAEGLDPYFDRSRRQEPGSESQQQGPAPPPPWQ